ncbi:flagellar hook assembly protein [Aliidongia dinghuensis]|uniref:Basal-body rod modification protein FlgD n=1 Tax=Aliidongia dinghuensis TaxID=1867774 RepID=A0A8J3E4I4_9PROT|nr:flagellar hook assembly protein FlgD [Aliidongia dinghuensis]GGF39040.1 flagellar hook assembly protein [Aliidongia dinghuensis]
MSNVGGIGTNGTNNSSSSNSASSASSSSNSSSSAISASVQSEYNTFLTILTTELQNQDPTSPLDTNQFTSQLVQFSSLEQNLQTNSLLQQLVTNSTQGAVSSALGYLGHTVKATGNSFTLDGTSSDKPTLSYSLAGKANTAVLDVLNSNGQTVREIAVSTDAGSHSMTFDGQDSSGSQLPAGTYTFKVQAVDAHGTAIAATTYETGAVTGIDTSNGVVNLHIGSLTVPASNVVQVVS